MNTFFGGMFLLFIGFIIVRIVMFKTMTPDQVDKFRQDEKERNRKIVNGSAEGAKVLLDLFLSRRK